VLTVFLHLYLTDFEGVMDCTFSGHGPVARFIVGGVQIWGSNKGIFHHLNSADQRDSKPWVYDNSSTVLAILNI
jgi:hypothetical protein